MKLSMRIGTRGAEASKTSRPRIAKFSPFRLVLVRHLAGVVLLAVVVPVVCAAQRPAAANAVWISSSNAEPCPVNHFTYFRREVDLSTLPTDATLHVAADSNTHVWINGAIVRRKVTRYAMRLITTDAIDARGLLHTGIKGEAGCSTSLGK